ncbi:MAG TPA: hypothetical protein VMN82_08455 [Thermoanaerobaculia bacterium]|nr:hypothetical protein [Thermoanaerobaculia bacterium]
MAALGLAAVLGFPGAATASAADDAAGIPTGLCGRDGINGEPFWVASSVLLTPEGKPDRRFVGPGSIGSVEWVLQEPEKNGCVRFGAVIIDYVAHDHERGSVEDAVETASTILEGVVEAASPGFFEGGTPGQLYRVLPLRLMKGEAAPDRYYFFLRAGRVPVGTKSVCAQDAALPDPAIGSRVLLLADSRNGPNLEYIDVEEPEDIVVENPGGTVWIAKRLLTGRPELASLSFDDVVAEFDEVLAAQAAQR